MNNVSEKLQPVPMLDFTRQFASLRQEILESVTRVFDTQQFILGPATESFEQAAAAFCKVPHAAGCSSGTEALWLALKAAEIGPGDAVITTPFSFFATVSAILRAGARPLLADIDPKTFNLSADAVSREMEKNSGSNIKAVLPVHLYGQCADWDAFSEIQERQHVVLIEDAAQAIGATWRDVPAGGLGDLAAFSFYPTKNLSAAGDAGMVTTKSDVLDERVRMLRAHGMRRRYFHDEIGWNSRIDGVQSAVLEIKLRYLNEWNAARRRIAARYDQLLREVKLAASDIKEGLVLPFTDPRATHVFHQYTIRARRRDDLRAYLNSHGIGSEVYYPLPLHQQESLQNLGYRTGDFPESERAAAEVLSLPIYPELRDDEQETVVEAIRRFYA